MFLDIFRLYFFFLNSPPFQRCDILILHLSLVSFVHFDLVSLFYIAACYMPITFRCSYVHIFHCFSCLPFSMFPFYHPIFSVLNAKIKFCCTSYWQWLWIAYWKMSMKWKKQRKKKKEKIAYRTKRAHTIYIRKETMCDQWILLLFSLKNKKECAHKWSRVWDVCAVPCCTMR